MRAHMRLCRIPQRTQRGGTVEGLHDAIGQRPSVEEIGQQAIDTVSNHLFDRPGS